ncbi:MAG: hypothetical protein JWP01_1369 [Myxococcales bacterium]|nr:hypothetical protein [Myxococcales bacterium]
MKRPLRWLRRIVLGALALLVVAIIAALIIVHTDWGRDQIRQQIEATLVEMFPGGARVGSLEGSVFGTLTVRDVEISALDREPLVKVATIEIELSLWPLLLKTAHIDRVTVDDVLVTYRPQGPPPVVPPPNKTGWTVEVPHIEVSNLRATALTPQGLVSLDQGSANASAYVLPGDFANVTAALSARWQERGVAVAAVAGIRVGTEITVPFARLAVGDASVFANTVNLDQLTGRVTVNATSSAIAQLAPGVTVPGDVVATLDVTAGPRVVIAGRLGATSIDGAVLADVLAGTARGVIGARGLDFGKLSDAHVQGHGDAVVAFVTDGTFARGTVIATGTVVLPEELSVTVGTRAPTVQASRADDSGAIVGHALVAFDGQFDAAAETGRANLLMLGAAAGPSTIAVLGAVRIDPAQVTIERTLIGATSQDPDAASGGMAPIVGNVAIEAVVDGALDALDISGQIRGTRIVYADARIASLASRFALHLSPGTKGREVRGSAHAELGGVVNDGTPIGAITLDARPRADGTIAVTGRVRLALAPVIIDADAIVTPGEVITVALGDHRIHMPKGEFSGTGGTVRMDDREITIREVRTAPTGMKGKGRITVDATVGRLADTLTATIDAREVPASAIDPAYRGTANGQLSITRTGTKWAGSGTVTANGFSVAADTLAIDGEATFVVDGRRVRFDGRLANAELGAARIGIEVDGPRDLTDAEAWMRVQRSDLRVVTIGIDRLDLAALTDQRSAGIADGTLEIRGGVPSGSLSVRGVPTLAGDADADITLALTDVGFVDVTAKARVGALGAAEVLARLKIPDRVFDPASWQALGTNVVQRATVTAADVAVDARLLASLGIDLPYHGRASVELVVGAGGSSADLTLAVTKIRGGLLQRELDVAVAGHIDGTGTRGTLRVGSGPLTLLDLPDARSPVTITQWIADPRAGLGSPIAGTLTIPQVAVRDVLAIFGRTEVLSGTIAGSVKVGGTIARPTGIAVVDVENVKIRPRLAGRPAPVLEALHVDGSWDGTAGKVHITGTESGKGTLLVDVSGRPDRLTSVVATIKIAAFDLAPIVVFLPGALVGASGKVDADLTVRGLDARLANVRGTLHVIGGRVPLTPTLGTLRAADVLVTIDDKGLVAKLDGKIGGGSIKAQVASTAGEQATVNAEITKLSPIGALQPVVNGRFYGEFTRAGLTWSGKAKISRASIVVPTQTGVALLDAAAPEDLIFVDRAVPLAKRPQQAPERPWLIAEIEIEPTTVSMPEFQVDSLIAGNVQVAVGETVGLDGEITVERGTVEITGHRYRVEYGRVTFDGTPDARFDLKIAHDFPEVTTFVRFASRISAIDTLEPEFTSEPGVYTQGQLLGFFLGGAPGGDPSKQTAEAAAGLGAAIASTAFGKLLKRVPFISSLQLQFACRPSAGQSSASCSAGRWVTKKLYVSGEQRIAPRPDENAAEGKLEYIWKPNRTVEATGGNRAIFGVDLLWRRRW